ncbi:hypothetical protein [Acinetobacter baumannii]|nr:hypothetical protein [Acinetobacter baumannii]
MSHNVVIIGKTSVGKTTTFGAIKISMGQSNRHIVVEDINEIKSMV